MKATIGKATKTARRRSRSQRKERDLSVDTTGRVHLPDGGRLGALALVVTDDAGRADELEICGTAAELEELALQIATMATLVRQEEAKAKEEARDIHAEIARKRAARVKEKARREAELGRPLTPYEVLDLAEDVRDGRIG
jgi:hypothetical protein